MDCVVVMGVSGCGKSAVASRLAALFNSRWLEGDNFHPAANVQKMSAGIALQDEDRWPWFQLLADAINSDSGDVGPVIVSCSALRRSYRDFLRQECSKSLVFVCLQVGREELARRMTSRRNHFMAPSLLDSQLALLEPPTTDEHAIIADGTAPLDSLCLHIRDRLTGIQHE